MRKRAARSMRQHQTGAVAVMLGLTLAVLLGFAALAIDLGRTYVVRTELQNAADAAALAGAKELDQTAAGVGRAVDKAQAIALQHEFNFGTPVTIAREDMQVGSCPDVDVPACWVPVVGITDALAADKTFLKVDISSGSLAAFLGGLVGIPSTATYGRAVAGWFARDVAPIGICAVKDAAGASRAAAEALDLGNGEQELAQYGFRRGVSYNVFELGPLGASSDTYLLNPVDKVPGACDPANSSASATAPFVCAGVSTALSSTPGWVYGNTGISAGPIQAALNSRFNQYGGPSVCIPAEAPPDSNITSYSPAAADVWMDPMPSVQTMANPSSTPASSPMASAGQYGVLWAYSRAVKAAGTASEPTVGADFPSSPASAANAAWNALYPVPSASAPQPAAYPEPSPYDTGPHTTPGGMRNRRVLNLAIVDCANPESFEGSGACMRIRVAAVGRFFMQVPANFSSNPKKLEVEFAGLVGPSISPFEIKLYR